MSTSPEKKLASLEGWDYIVGDPEDFVHIDWSIEWTGLKNLEPDPDDQCKA